MSDFVRRTWAEVDLDALVANFRAIRAYVRPQSKTMAIVKADAYGHGAAFAAAELDAAGADWFGVSNIEEAEQLRLSGIEKPILILGYTPPEFAPALIKHRVTQALFSLEYAQALSKAAAAAGGTVETHLKLDTGMSRIGFVCHGEADEAALARDAVYACTLPGLHTSGVFTHFAVSDEPGNVFTALQFDRFCRAVSLLEEKGLRFELRHCCNSAGLLAYPDMQLDLVRPGIILYGLAPSPEMALPISLTPVMSLKTVLFQAKRLPAHTPVSYGMIYETPGERVLGTLPVGYADGFARSLSGKADVLLHGKRARIVGRVCMDQCMADITAIPEAQAGDTATLFGHDGGAALPVDELAAHMGTINYEVVCLIGKRVPRVYFKDGRQVGQLNYILP